MYVPLRDRVGHLAHLLSLSFRKQVDSQTRELGLGASEVFLMIALKKHGPQSLVEMAKLMELAHPTVLRHLDTLESLGYLNRVPHAEDRRVKLLELTEKGDELIDGLQNVFVSIHKQAFEGIKEKHLEITKDTILKMLENLGWKSHLDDPCHAPPQDVLHSHLAKSVKQ